MQKCPLCPVMVQGGDVGMADHLRVCHPGYRRPQHPTDAPVTRREDTPVTPRRAAAIRRPWVADIEARRVPRQRAIERTRRGAALARAVLAGDVDADTLQPRPGSAPPRVEMTSCRLCFRPHEAPPGTVCDRCDRQGRA